MPINILLHKLGFSRNEARVYLAGLETGAASAQDIAAVAGLKRTTAYSVLSYLVNRGVVAKTKIKGKNRFVAEPPQRLLSLVNELESGIREALPELAAIYNKQGAKPKITFYEGPNAVQKVYDDTLEEKPTEILEYNTNAYFEGKANVDPNYIQKRVALGIKARRLAGKGSKWDIKHRYLDEKELSQTLVVAKEQFDPQIEVNIYNNKVAFLNYAENMSVIIESQAIAEAMRQAYELSWKGAKSLEINK
ncbi:MAG: helix-turn-helix domain-containing protein [Candidatus Doudnabacteria bacterium]|nr:helix-turn-helix domain-containing protein [Candidatus Doudnabacteria bacterium]